ncbi:MAG TPA: hypothetical protein VKH81_17365 [Candidatus Angelobacter sp.]|nr:hypothetical protein [Candidatus Angelobacter sp.]
MNEPKQEAPSNTTSPQAAAGAKRAQKIRSSRYEWENKSGEGEPAPETKATRQSLLTTVVGWLKKFRLANRSFFDKDDDATASAA